MPALRRFPTSDNMTFTRLSASLKQPTYLPHALESVSQLLTSYYLH